MNRIDSTVQEILNSMGDFYDKCVQFARLLDENEIDNGQLFEQIVTCMSFSNAGITENSADNPNEDVLEFRERYLSLTREIVRTIVAENLSEAEFYAKLYSVLYTMTTPIFPNTESSKGSLLFILIRDVPELPYFQPQNLLEMENEDYKQAIDNMMPQLQKAIYMLKRNFRSKTEEASQLWEIANTLESRDDKIVYWAAVIGAIRMQTRNGKLAQSSKLDRGE